MSGSTGTNCGCCAGVAQATPVGVTNRPGLPEIAARVGTYGSFLSSMLAALSAETVPALTGLTARSTADWSIALLDAFAVTADVLTFYQERYAQENWLRTATERRSILELARLIGYELAPGVAAHTPIAFTLDSTAGSPTSLDLPVGTKVQSTPGPGQTAATFETVEDITAHPEWSAMTLQLTQLHYPAAGDTQIWLAGTALNLKSGDTLLLVGKEKQSQPATSEQWDFRRIDGVTVDNTNQRTLVTLQLPVANLPGETPSSAANVYVFRRQGSLFGYNAIPWNALPIALRVGELSPGTATVIAGAYAGMQNQWVDQPLVEGAQSTTTIDLDAVYSQIAVNGWIVLSEPGSGTKPRAEAFEVQGVAETNVAQFALTGRATQLTVQGKNIAWFSPRTAAAFVQSELLPLAEQPITEPLSGGALTLSNRVTGLLPGRSLIVAGQAPRVTVAAGITSLELTADDGTTRAMAPADQFLVISVTPEALHVRTYRLQALDGFVGTIIAAPFQIPFSPPAKIDPVQAELVMVASLDDSDLLHTTIVLATPLANTYDLGSVTVYGNIAQATHGETVQEVMGNGDASATFQSFALRQPPVTQVLAPTPSGVQSTLGVTANGLSWTEMETLYGAGPTAQVFAERRDNAGNTSVLFGDGALYGARLPSGNVNVQAQYRKGLGTAGNLNPGQLNLLMSRPLGLKAATNPLPAVDGADPEPFALARVSAPRSVATLDRAVSLEDYAAFALGFPGIAKAIATWSWDNFEQSVVLTLAGTDGAQVLPTGDLAATLATALADFSDPSARVTLQSYVPVTFLLGLNILPSTPDGLAAAQATAEAALRAAFAFDNRDFGQSVALSEVIAIAQAADGVEAVRVTALYRKDQPPGGPLVNARLDAFVAPPGSQSAGAAELLTLDPAPLLSLGAMT